MYGKKRQAGQVMFDILTETRTAVVIGIALLGGYHAFDEQSVSQMRSKRDVRFLRAWVVRRVAVNVAQPILVPASLKSKVQICTPCDIAVRFLILIIQPAFRLG